jgi:uncharacterized protein YydD (DUF2326 family)
MIRELWSNRSSFKRLRFRPGLNIVLATRSALPADRGTEELSRRTRNGAGKSSLVDIIRFAFGGEIGRNTSVLDAPVLKEDSFFISFDLWGSVVTAIRSPATKGRIEIQGDFANWTVRPDVNQKTGIVTISAKNWSDLLGRQFFGLPAESQIAARSNLSNAACIAFFVRKSRDGAFQHWVLTHRTQSAVKQGVPLFYLFGLDSDVALKFVRLDETKKAAAELRRAFDKGLLTKTIGAPGHLKNELVKTRRRAERIKGRLEGTDVIDFYGDYEKEAAELDKNINDRNDANYTDEQLLQDLQNATKDEAEPALPDIERLYREASVVLPEISLQQYEKVKVFHDAVISNRKAHLSAEITAAKARVQARNKQIEKLVQRHRVILDLLQSGVSLSHYRKLDHELTQANTEAAELSQRLELAEKVEGLRLDARVEKAEAERALRNELRERRELVESAILTFQEISSAIYQSPAEFDIAPTRVCLQFRDVFTRTDQNQTRNAVP